MISVEQIRLLETKVQQAVSLLANLQEENKTLRTRLSKYEERIDELEFLIEEFKEEQSEIEQGIISALNQLNELSAGHSTSEPAAPEEKTRNTAETPTPPPVQHQTDQQEAEVEEQGDSNAGATLQPEETQDTLGSPEEAGDAYHEEPAQEPDDDDQELDLF
ncbi:cell division protein ZapB [Spirochaeta lutea]|uniref:cell division protein ZapB n=1 Tax=Spirochaeta lutea TaxID=1480694 RepID=UPI00068A599C|nr:cell division protein ZapB [Spirochaeta lutea]